MHEYYVYMMTSDYYGTLYIGVSNNLLRRVQEHKEGKVKGFTQKHKIHKLVWYQSCNDIHEAIEHEKRMKKRKRQRKINTIEEINPTRDDLSIGLSP